MALLNQRPHLVELVKCVVVGDNAVGKTRLICARACATPITKQQLLATHVPTVWAIDQYQISPQILERSYDIVDGVHVSLRLWDTFGDHEKDRRFAYGSHFSRSDVVLLCFSIANPTSLKHAMLMWYPEIKQFCPHAPIILTGCQADLRYADLDLYNKHKGPFARKVKPSDIMMPDEGRSVAKELGIPYYETSVVDNYGIRDLFHNVTRAALLARRSFLFWKSNLKKVQKPLLQLPFLPPPPPLPIITVPSNTHVEELRDFFHNPVCSDVTFLAQGVRIPANKVFLVAASPFFKDLFMMDLSQDLANQKDPCTTLLDNDPSKENGSSSRTSSLQVTTSQLLGQADANGNGAADFHGFPSHVLDHSVVHSIHLANGSDPFVESERPTLHTFVTLSPNVLPNVFQHCLEFLHTGQLEEKGLPLADMLHLAKELQMVVLVEMIRNHLNEEEFMNSEVSFRFHKRRNSALKELLSKGVLSDVLFRVDDGTVPAHKPLLMAHCDVMSAMFGGNFLESSINEVPLPGTTKACLQALLEYLYTGQLSLPANRDCIGLIELANRICLPRLVALTEHHIVLELTRARENNQDIHLEVLMLLEPAQLHNACQLSAWCLSHITTNYKHICRRYSKELHTLTPETQQYVAKHRWPPIWYLKERDYYEKAQRERERAEEKKAALQKVKRVKKWCF
ncbi:rho-related BTB domain-containing protein 1-like isoform X3 [Branchiostoma floridae x Branchiostoma belcheri]